MGKSILSFLLVVLITVGLLALAIFGVEIGDFKIYSVVDENGITKGLDLVGGSSITYEAQVAEGTSAAEISSGMSSSLAIIQQRLTSLGYTEATAVLSGDRRITVEIPAISDPEEAVQRLGTTAELSFVDSTGEVVLEGSTDIASAAVEYGKLSSTGSNQHYVLLTLTDEAVSKFAEATRKMSGSDYVDNDLNYISIMLDDEVVSSPRVSEEINSSTCVISGGFTADDAQWLADLINGGKLPFALQEVQLSSVGPTLGERALSTSVLAGLIGVLLIMLFMLIMYRVPGVVSCIALCTYGAIVGLIVANVHLNLSLPGIAGIILGIGMAVDANVVIFERIKEEIGLGKTVKASVHSGFRRAFTAILDSNITTIIAAIVLWIFGTGTIVGFAQTLFVSVIVSMFTAVVVSRFLLNSLIGMNIKSKKAFGA